MELQPINVLFAFSLIRICLLKSQNSTNNSEVGSVIQSEFFIRKRLQEFDLNELGVCSVFMYA